MTLRILPENHFDASADLYSIPTAVATLPITNLQSNIRDRVWRSPNLDQQIINGTFGGNVRVVSAFGVWPSDGASLIGSKWHLTLYSDVARTTVVLDQTWDFFAFTSSAFGVAAYGVEPYGVEIGDRTARLAPMLKFFAPVNVSAFTMLVTNGGAVDTPYFESRRIWLADYVQAPYNASYGAAPAWRSGSQHQRTVGVSLRRLARGRWRELRFSTIFTTEADRAAWSDLSCACDPANEIVIDLFPADAYPRRERDFTVMGSLEVLNPQVFENFNFHRLDLSIAES